MKERVNPYCGNECKTNDGKACAGCDKAKISDVPELKNYSQAKRFVVKFLGPTARIWYRDGDGTVKVGFEASPGRRVVGFANTFQEAVELAVRSFRS